MFEINSTTIPTEDAGLNTPGETTVIDENTK
jgi:hypothetical protein